MNGQLQTQAVWRWRITRTLESVGRHGWMGIAALAVAILIAATVLRGMSQKIESLESELNDLRQGKGSGQVSNGAAQLSAILPGQAASADFATALHNLAARDSVRIDRMEYQLQREPGKPILVYRADLVAVAPYLQLRNWLDAVLRERPTVAIEELVFERPNGDVAEVIARVRLALFMKGEP